jgi:hypothetical protein
MFFSSSKIPLEDLSLRRDEEAETLYRGLVRVDTN